MSADHKPDRPLMAAICFAMREGEREGTTKFPSEWLVAAAASKLADLEGAVISLLESGTITFDAGCFSLTERGREKTDALISELEAITPGMFDGIKAGQAMDRPLR